MPKKNDSYYFQNFIERVERGCRAAKILGGNLDHFGTGLLQDKLGELHRIEHNADKKKHKVMVALVRVSITPIEQENIILLSQNIDEVTDKIGGVLIHIYISNTQQIRPEVLTSIKVIIRCCEMFKGVMEELVDFRKPKTLHGLAIEISVLEEKGDSLLIDFMRSLHAEMTGPIKIIAWREVYVYPEKCCNACEHVTDVVGSVIMKNT